MVSSFRFQCSLMKKLRFDKTYENWIVDRESLNAHDALGVLVNQLKKEGYKISESH